eukprot:m.149694 g.149694  ORF g.149694 m.149694 type:complete len:82 (-) comp17354_c0_seq2:90-335(-)
MDVYLNRIKRPSFLEAGGGLVNVGVSPDLDAHLQIDSRETDLEVSVPATFCVEVVGLATRESRDAGMDKPVVDQTDQGEEE